jgi:hypothetical protein
VRTIEQWAGVEVSAAATKAAAVSKSPRRQ